MMTLHWIYQTALNFSGLQIVQEQDSAQVNVFRYFGKRYLKKIFKDICTNI